MELLNEVLMIVNALHEESLENVIQSSKSGEVYERERFLGQLEAYNNVCKLICKRIKSNQLDKK